jgi:molybdenum ABC transporter molybdate-binding protein
MRPLRQVVVALCLLAPPLCGKADISLAAPTSWARTVNALVDGWKAAGGGEVTVSFGNSDDQSVEVEAGSRNFDLLILGDPHALYRMVSKGLSLPALRLASSPIVLAAGERDKEVALDADFPALLGKDRLAVYDPDSDGIGIATRDILGQAGLWEPLANRMTRLRAAGAMIRAVQTGEARFAILLRADLAQAATLHEGAVLAPEGSGQEYIYLVAPVKSHFRPEIARFLAYLRSGAAAEEIRRRGYTPQAGNN